MGQEAEDLDVGDGEGHVIDGQAIPEALGQMVDFERGDPTSLSTPEADV